VAKAPLTLRDIAEATGFSVPTVCNVLGSRGNAYNERTRKRITDAARRLKYRPNALARGVRRGRFGAIGLLVSMSRGGDLLPPRLQRGIARSLDGRDNHLVTFWAKDRDFADASSFPKMLRQHMVDGVLVNYHYDVPERIQEQVRGSGVPVVWINSRFETDCIYPDESDAARTATAELIRLGHEKIAYVEWSHGAEDLAGHFSIPDRFDGYLQGMKEAGLEPDARWRGRGPATARMRRAAEWLSPPDRPTALLVTNPRHAAQILAVATLRLGLDVPGDLSVVTFGPTHASFNFGGPEPASMRLAWDELGREAARMLLGRIERPDLPAANRTVRRCLYPGEALAGPK
jgi:LacI family transcriptional regulator